MVAQHSLDALRASRAATKAPTFCSTLRSPRRGAQGPAAQLRTLVEPHDFARPARRSRHPICRRSSLPGQLALVKKIHDLLGQEVMGHLEFVASRQGDCFGLPLVRFTTPERLAEIIAIHEAMGAPIFNPHRYTLEAAA